MMFLLKINTLCIKLFFSVSQTNMGKNQGLWWSYGMGFPNSDTEEPGAEPDPLNGVRSIRELYELASTNYSGKYTVPVSFNHGCDLHLSF